MGSAGRALLCKNGHVLFWLDEGLHWSEQTWERLEHEKQKGCACGAMFAHEEAHYGALNDCVEYPLWWEDAGYDYIKVPINGAVYDKDDNPVEGAYNRMRVQKYKKVDLDAGEWAERNALRLKSVEL